MNLKIDIFLALRYLSSRRDNFISVASVSSLLGIIFGVAALIIVLSVMNGFRTEFAKKFTSFTGDLEIYSVQKKIRDYQKIVKNIKNHNYIVSAIPIIQQQVLLSNTKQISTGAQIKALKYQDLICKKIIADNIIFGSLDNFRRLDAIAIGHIMARNMNLKIGDKIKLIVPQTNNTIIGTIPRFKTLIVSAIFNIGMSEYDAYIAFIPLATGQKIFKLQNKVNLIEIYSVNPANANNYRFKLLELINSDLRIVDWQTKNYAFFNALKTERVVMFVILSIIIFVAAFNIVSSLTMLVKDKTAEIAIMRTIGASRFMIMRIFIFCGLIIGVIGIAIGILIGISFSLNIVSIKSFLESLTNMEFFDPVVYYLSELPCDLHTLDVVKVGMFTLILSLLATIYPAWRAAKIEPVEALR